MTFIDAVAPLLIAMALLILGIPWLLRFMLWYFRRVLK